MKSANTGIGTSNPEVLNLSPHGFWLMVDGAEFFLAFDDFPWFRSATMEQIFAVELYHGTHLYWPALDVDLSLDQILHPEQFPLIAK